MSWHTSFLIAPLLSAARREGKHPDGVVTLSGSTAPQVNSQRCSINISVASAAEPERPVKLCYVYVLTPDTKLKNQLGDLSAQCVDGVLLCVCVCVCLCVCVCVCGVWYV